jgi:hypothetical protein
MKKRVQIRIFFLIFISLVVSSNIALSQENKIRIVNKGAELKLKPSFDSLTIMELPIGGELLLEERLGEWLKIKLPPNKDGIVQTGYVHLSFVEYLMKQEPQKVKTIDIPLDNKLIQPAQGATYDQWKENISKEQSKIITGIILTTGGAALLIPSIAYTFYNQWPSNISEGRVLSGGGWAIVIIGDVLGIAGVIGGLSLAIPAGSRKRALEEEGKIKGYMTAGIITKFRAFGIQIGASF